MHASRMPSGSKVTKLAGESLGAVSSARKVPACSAKYSHTNAHFSTSARASRIGLPISAVMVAACVATSLRNSLAASRSTRPRSSYVRRRQPRDACHAVSSAASIPASSVISKLSISCSVAGSIEVNRAIPVAIRRWYGSCAARGQHQHGREVEDQPAAETVDDSGDSSQHRLALFGGKMQVVAMGAQKREPRVA